MGEEKSAQPESEFLPAGNLRFTDVVGNRQLTFRIRSMQCPVVQIETAGKRRHFGPGQIGVVFVDPLFKTGELPQSPGDPFGGDFRPARQLRAGKLDAAESQQTAAGGLKFQTAELSGFKLIDRIVKLLLRKC